METFLLLTEHFPGPRLHGSIGFLPKGAGGPMRGAGQLLAYAWAGAKTCASWRNMLERVVLLSGEEYG